MELFEAVSAQRGHKLGAEVERLGLDAQAKFLSYSEHVLPLFKNLVSEANWNPILLSDEGQILAISRADDSITLEPGAQIEIAPRPCETVMELMEVENRIGDELLSNPVAKSWKWVWWGVNPQLPLEDIELIPSKRYQIMTEYFPTVGQRGREMMRLTTGSHLNLDFFSDQEAIQMLQASCAMFPAVGGLFAHSPFYQGNLSPFLSVRHQIWKETDAQRSGFAEAFLSDDFNLSYYVNIVENTPLMFYQDEQSVYQPANGRSLSQLSKEIQKRNALSAMRQLFFDVRLKPCCVEFRALDQQIPAMREAAFAMLVGILYDEENRRWASLEAKRLGAKKIRYLQDQASISGLKNDEIFALSKSLFEKSIKGLERRAKSESLCLLPIEKLLAKRMSSGELELSQSLD